MVNILDLESISTAGSVGFLLIFGIVNLAGYRRAKQTGSKKSIPLVGFILCLIATATLLQQQYTSNILGGVIISLSIIIFCFLVEWIYKKTEKNNPRK